MSVIPPHYTERYVNQRYNKALQIVQHLPASSNFQPSREEKLELYAYYKQVTHGNINTQRPGIFDVVGRAKWDAWKKVEGMDRQTAKYKYVETLLRAATEAYKRDAGRATAEQIIRAFAVMQPSGDHDTEDDDDDDTEDDDLINNEEDSSIASADAEERAYLQEIQANTQTISSSPSFNAFGNQRRLVSPALRSVSSRPGSARSRRTRAWHGKSTGTGSVTSTQSGQASLVTAPTAPLQSDRRLSHSSYSSSPANSRRPPAVSQGHNDDRLLPHMISQHERIALTRYAHSHLDEEDQHVNPWANAVQRYELDDGHSSDSSNSDRTPGRRRSGRLQPVSPRVHPPLSPKQQYTPGTRPRFQPPLHGSSASSSVTATAANVPGAIAARGATSTLFKSQDSHPNSRLGMVEQQHYQQQQQYMSVVALGPATKRVLESLQAEIVALNDRIDELRQELLERDQHRPSSPIAAKKEPSQTSNSVNTRTDSSDDDEMSEGWKWVIKAAAKHAAINLITVLLFILILYKRGSPIAFIITGQFSRLWQTVKHRLFFQVVV